MTDYKVIRSKRKSLTLQVRPEGVIVRAPLRASDALIARVVGQKRDWIEKQLRAMESAREALSGAKKLSGQELKQLKARAALEFPPLVQKYAAAFGVTYGRITIRKQATRWGSCTAKGNLSFNCLLLLAPREVMESVVAHELCHRRHMDHSKAFYADLARVFPRHGECSAWLKQNGALLLWMGSEDEKIPGEL